jgi:sensor histidine kinase YesM
MLMTSDSLSALRHIGPLVRRGPITFMPTADKDARWLDAIVLTVALWLFTLLMFLPVIIERHPGAGLTSIALDSSTIAVSMLLAMPIFLVFRKTLDWPSGARALILVAAVIFTAIFNRIFDILWSGWVTENFLSSWAAMPQTIERSYDATLKYILVFSVNLALFQLSFARRRERRQERQLVDARSAAQLAQLAALRYQLNPHFLFNTLNSISALIVTRRNEDAEQMTDKLSNFLRTSLACDPAQLVPLDEELALIEEYLDIEAVRFGERLDVQIDCDPVAGEALVPGFLVQPLVENAIKHGVAPSREPVKIAVHAAIENGDLCISVRNDSLPVNAAAQLAPSGVGLVNVQRRLEAVYGKAASLTAHRDETSYTATICIPEILRTR